MSANTSLTPDFQRIAKHQKISLYAIAVAVVAFVSMPLTGRAELFFITAPVVAIIQYISLYQMAKELHMMGTYALYVISSILLGPVALLFFVILHCRAAKTLKQAGILLGLFGAKLVK